MFPKFANVFEAGSIFQGQSQMREV